jgi:hypothetical protein
MVLGPDSAPGDFYAGTSACLSALLKAERYEELIDIAGGDILWDYRQWAVRALMAQGRKAEALRLAESSRGTWTSDLAVDRMAEEILLSSGLVDEAYRRYGLTANRSSTYLATFRAVAKKYPSKAPADILDDLVATTPGEEGKWFAAAKSAGLLDEALELARMSPCDPRTLTRAARDFAQEQPGFAVEAGMLALHWLVEGYGYEITSADVWAAFEETVAAAGQLGDPRGVEGRVRTLVEADSRNRGFVAQVLGRALGPK